MVDQHHLAPASGSGERTHQTGGAGANDYNVSNGHSVVPRSSGHDRSHAERGDDNPADDYFRESARAATCP
ncbi:hypothetical protein ALP63_102498 [Pseudomonas syringae pv. aceris]|nr:hypothetical protein ALP63_102498 [Pseudomonas syringae pv. aceris]RMS68378.1 hypothetical protein ALP62_102501 [Pseudomonas syringae pv. aceris]